MSWARAALIGVVVVGVAFGALVYVPDLMLSNLPGDRSARVAVTTWFTLALASMMWGLRRLQARGRL